MSVQEMCFEINIPTLWVGAGMFSDIINRDALVAQRIEQSTPKAEVVGSTPTEGTPNYGVWAFGLDAVFVPLRPFNPPRCAVILIRFDW